jgi:hypothetical protein
MKPQLWPQLNIGGALGLELIALGLLSSLGPPWEELDLGLGDSSAETFVESFDS